MNPFVLMAISAGMNMAQGAAQAAQKKKQMLAASEQTRYAPWTGESGNGAFNQAMQIDPFGGTLKGLAGTAASTAAGMASDEKYDKLLGAMKDQTQPNAINAMQFGGGSENLSNPYSKMMKHIG